MSTLVVDFSTGPLVSTFVDVSTERVKIGWKPLHSSSFGILLPWYYSSVLYCYVLSFIIRNTTFAAPCEFGLYKCHYYYFFDPR